MPGDPCTCSCWSTSILRIARYAAATTLGSCCRRTRRSGRKSSNRLHTTGSTSACSVTCSCLTKLRRRSVPSGQRQQQHLDRHSNNNLAVSSSSSSSSSSSDNSTVTPRRTRTDQRGRVHVVQRWHLGSFCGTAAWCSCSRGLDSSCCRHRTGLPVFFPCLRALLHTCSTR